MMATKGVVLLSLGLISAVVGNCPDGWVRHGATCYHFSHDTETFAGATVMCQYMGGPLAEVADLTENHYLGGMVDTLDHDFWIGATDVGETGVWTWAESGNDVTLFPWAPHNPDNDHCIIIDGDGLWHDRECHDNYNYICEKQDAGLARQHRNRSFDRTTVKIRYGDHLQNIDLNSEMV